MDLSDCDESSAEENVLKKRQEIEPSTIELDPKSKRMEQLDNINLIEDATISSSPTGSVNRKFNSESKGLENYSRLQGVALDSGRSNCDKEEQSEMGTEKSDGDRKSPTITFDESEVSICTSVIAIDLLYTISLP